MEMPAACSFPGEKARSWEALGELQVVRTWPGRPLTLRHWKVPHTVTPALGSRAQVIIMRTLWDPGDTIEPPVLLKTTPRL